MNLEEGNREPSVRVRRTLLFTIPAPAPFFDPENQVRP